MKTSISRAEFIGSCRFDAMEWRQSVDFFCRNEVCGGSSPQRVQGSILVSSTCSQSTRVLRAPAPVTPPSLVCVHTSTPPGHVLTQSHGTSDPDTRSRLSTIFKTLSVECFCEIFLKLPFLAISF